MKSFIVKITLFLSLVVLCLSFKTVETFAATDFTGDPGDIQELISRGIIDESFIPDGSITRGELAAFLVRSFISDASSSSGFDNSLGGIFGYFDSVHSEFLVGSFISDASSLGGYSPDTVVNREELATVVVSALGFNATGSGEQLPFNDSDTISSWARDYVGYAVANGLMSGDPSNNFNPQNPVTGLEVVQTTLNTIEHAEALGIILPPVPVSDPEPELEKEESSVTKIKKAIGQIVIEDIVEGPNEGAGKIIFTDSGITIEDLLGAIVALDNSKQIYEFLRNGDIWTDFTVNIDPITDRLVVTAENGVNKHTYSFELPENPNNPPVDQEPEQVQQPQNLAEQAPSTDEVVIPE
ncbi:S-layer homology domain-containing protein [Psychrobacillus sp.]|uniref:S-layer homology domain-containing protein n=1 Tax=Psychrobacillus sp. TaxID=1871623 RepID=UPI0028BDC814|nr:S-layer homology domain-containing protein [Psychrobacillus sp.]